MRCKAHNFTPFRTKPISKQSEFQNISFYFMRLTTFYFTYTSIDFNDYFITWIYTIWPYTDIYR